jgi:hypothetical protein
MVFLFVLLEDYALFSLSVPLSIPSAFSDPVPEPATSLSVTSPRSEVVASVEDEVSSVPFVPSYCVKPSVFSVRVDSASFPRPSLDVPLRPLVEELFPPALSRRPPVACRVPAPPRERELVVPPEVPLPVDEPPRVALLPPPRLLDDDLVAPLDAVEVRPPPLDASPPFFATAVFVRSLADAKPRLELAEFLLAPPPELLPFEAPDRLLLPPRFWELPFEDAPLLADFEEELPDRPPDVDLELPERPELFPEDEPRFDAADPPLEEEPDFEAPLEAPFEADLVAPRLLLEPLEADPPLEPVDDLLLPFDAEDPPLEFPEDLLLPFEAPLVADLELPLEALFVAPPRPELPWEELPDLLELPLDADFEPLLLPDFEAPFDALLLLLFAALRLLPPLLAAFFGAAFFVAFAMIFNGF